MLRGPILMTVSVMLLGPFSLTGCGDGDAGGFLGLGDLCESGGDCASGFCSDSVCCDSACDSTCVACTETLTGVMGGVCAAISSGTDPDSECAVEASETCGVSDAGCNGNNISPGCQLYDATTECAPLSCTAGLFSEARMCDGEGTCVAAITSTCDPYACNASNDGCLVSCTAQSDCGAAYCDQFHQCVAKKTDGQVCSETYECDSGYCVDGVCCDTLCGDECDACSQITGAATDGVCSVVPYGTAIQPSCSAGICDGISAQCTATCNTQVITENLRPLDLVFVIDNSGSMGARIAAVEANINPNFADVLAAAGIDYQFIMVTDYGTASLDVCIQPPLGSNATCSSTPIAVPDQFVHYDVNVQSHDALCVLLDTLLGPNAGGELDEWGIHQDGWHPMLRPEALKAFIPITDDGVTCNWNGHSLNDADQEAAGQTAANTFDQLLLGLSPTQFGSSSDRNYSFYPILGHATPDGDTPLPWSDSVTVATCTSGVAPGTGYQWLAKDTQGLRHQVCSPQDYDLIFQNIATDLANRVRSPCTFMIPDPPGGVIDQSTILLEFTPSSGPQEMFTPVANEAACVADAYYIEGDNVKLCPIECSQVENDPSATLEIHYFCN